jgi:amino acid adenylation domain-containing protein/non-ribosomal peptide synthase protein (TIGR01720 family)
MKNIESFYPLSPLQAGLLFHTIASPESAVYFQQSNCIIRGNFDTAAWRKAWQTIVDMHPILRSAFIWEKLEKPIQVVHRDVQLPVEEQDWRGLDPEEQQWRLEEYLCHDRRCGFNLAKPPLMRMALFRIADEAYYWVSSHHHLLLDGWSGQLLLQQMTRLYEAFRKGETAEEKPGRPYRDYISWLLRQSQAAAEQFWKERLKGFAKANALAGRIATPLTHGGEELHADEWLELTTAEAERLYSFARQQQLTLNTVIQGAWALFVAHYSGDQDVVFGASVSGRPAELEGVEQMVGVFINAQPVRVHIGADQKVKPWLQQLQVNAVAARQYEYAPLSLVQECSEIEHGKPLFETLLIVKNFPVYHSEILEATLRVEQMRNYERTNYPLCLVLDPGASLQMQFTYNRSFFSRSTIREMFGTLRRLLLEFVCSPDRRVAEVQRSVVEGFRLSPQQQQTMQSMEERPGQPHRTVLAIEVEADLDFQDIKNAFMTVAGQHEVLRTYFKKLPGTTVPFQIVKMEVEAQVEAQDLRSCASQERHSEMESLLSRHTSISAPASEGAGLWLSIVYAEKQKTVLVVSFSALCGDIRSAHNLLHDTLCSYHGEARKQEVVKYSEYSEWQNDFLNSHEAVEGCQHWQAQLASLQPPVLPLDNADAFEPGDVQVLTHSFELSPELVQKLGQASEQLDTSASVFLLACWCALLCRLREQNEFAVGVVFDGRTDEDIQTAFGRFERRLPLRLSANPSLPFSNFLRDVESNALRAYTQQSCFSLHGIPQKIRDAKPWLGWGFRFVEAAEPQAGSAASRIVYERSASEGYAFDLVASANSQGVYCNLLYDGNTVSAAVASRLAASFQSLMTQAVNDPEIEIERLPLLDKAGTAAVLQAANRKITRLDDDVLVHRWFQKQVATSPNQVAVISGNRSITFAELHVQSNQLAHRLRQLGVGPDVLVGICLERSIEMVVALLGVLKAGGAYVPLDPQYPAERLAYMIQDASARVLLSQASLGDRLPVSNVEIVWVDSDAQLAQEPADDLQELATADSLAYVIYTSGTTGKPKGAALPHRALSNHMRWMVETFGFTPQDRILQKTPFSFDASVWEFYAPLLTGAQLFMYPPDPHPLPADMVKAVRAYDVTVLQVVPAVLRLLLDEPGFVMCRSLRYVFAGGEALPVEAEIKLSEQLPAARLVNLYGPTETCIDATFWTCTEQQSTTSIVPIGRCITNDHAYVVDNHFQLLPAGAPGELCIAGEGLGRGYWKRPELTAELFVPNPFSSEPGARMYRSGDLAFWREDYSLQYCGRIDAQVKINGLRIELGEIEAVVASHPQVKQAVVIRCQAEGGSARLVGYVIPAENGAVPAGNILREWLKTKLPEYMVPAAFVMMERFPLTPNGKLDRNSLPDPVIQSSNSAKMERARNPKEQVLVDIWRSLLRVSEVGTHENFFELGGDSILTLQVVARANEAGLRITPRQIFEHQTIEALAAVAEFVQQPDHEQQAPEIGDVPLTPVQHDFFERGYPDINHYNHALLLELLRPVDAESLRSAVEQIVGRHDAFRLRFSRSESGWRQSVVSAEHHSIFSVVDLPRMQQHRAEIDKRFASLQKSLDLQQGPIIRTELVRFGSQSYLLIVAHHIAVDAVSWGIVLEEMRVSYEQLSKGDPVKLPQPTASFAKWAHQLAQYCQSEELRGEESIWLDPARENIAPVPVDFPQGRNIEASSQTVHTRLNANETHALLRDVVATSHAQIREVLLATLARTLGRWTGERRMLITVEGHGREELNVPVNVSRTVGWFTTLVPVVLEYDTDDSLSVLRNVKEQLRRIPRNGIGHGVLRYLGTREDVRARLIALPKPQISFNYLGQSDQREASEESWFRLSTEAPAGSRRPDANRNHLLEVEAVVSNGCLYVDWIYSEEFYRRETVEGQAENFLSELRSLIDLSLVSPAAAFTPSDFPHAGLNQKDLDVLVAKLG